MKKIGYILAAAVAAFTLSTSAFAANVIDDIGEGAGDILDGIGEGADDILDGAGDAADDVADGVGDAVNGADETTVDAAGDIAGEITTDAAAIDTAETSDMETTTSEMTSAEITTNTLVNGADNVNTGVAIGGTLLGAVAAAFAAGFSKKRK